MATSTKNGLMSSRFLSSNDFFSLPMNNTYSGDLNELYKYVTEGMSVCNVGVITNGVQNYSLVIHVQRTKQGDNSISQYIIQIQPDNLNKLKFRTGTGNGTGISYTDWVSFIA